MKYPHNLLVIDLETDGLDINSCNIKVFGGYDVNQDKFYIWKWNDKTKRKIQQLINSVDFILTFNGINFDIPILQRHGIVINLTNHFDLFNIIKYKRTPWIKPDGFKSYSLKNIIDELKLQNEFGGKGEIDFMIFRKNEWTDEEQKLIVDYLKQDLILTARLWKFMYDRFDMFKEYINPKHVQRYGHLVSSIGTYVYRAICYMANIEELYDSNAKKKTYPGAFVSSPKKESVVGNILCMDYSSLYPNMYIQSNLFSHNCKCCSKEQKWHGGEFYKVTGFYCKKTQGKIEKLIKKFLILKDEASITGDPRRGVYKNIINTLYGVSGNPVFYSLYNYDSASDCTLLGQQVIKKTRDLLTEAGYICLYTDTDSIYIEIPDGKTIDDCIRECNKVSNYLGNKFPFPCDRFLLKKEYEIKYLQFFKDGNNVGLKKKNYLFVYENKDGSKSIGIKGLDIIQKDCSELSRTIYKKYLKQEIIDRLNCKFDKYYITELIMKLLKENIYIIAKPFNIKEADQYTSKTSIQYLILEKYGSGDHKLIRNYRIGAGRGVKYCSIEEAKKLSIKDLDLELVFQELSPFINDDMIGDDQLTLKKFEEK
jgi:DNA polymerase elongation subunit (family B)